jgi:putative ABC transport system permease protein
MAGSTTLRSEYVSRAGKLAWKDFRAQRGRSAILVISLALSISGISGVRGAANAALEALHRGSRASLAGDVCAETSAELSDEQVAALNAMRKEGIQWTLVSVILTMASSDQSPDPVFVAVKAIDPQEYPLYGGLKMVADLRGDGVIVSQNTLRRLHVRVGDQIRVAGSRFRISAVGKAEPEQILGLFSRGLRCVLSREALERSDIARAGNSASNRILVRLPPGFDLRIAKLRLQSLIPEGNVFDYQEVNQNIGVRIESVGAFLSETALLALALGAIGIAVAVRQHIEQRIEIFAVMKAVGARNAQLVALFLMEIAMLIAAALPLGVALGWIVKMSLFSLAADYIPLAAASGGNDVLFLEAAGAAILAMIPASAEPVWMLCRLRPACVVRKESPHIDSPGRTLVSASVALLVVAFIAISYHVLGSFTAAVEFTGALFLGILLSLFLTRVSLRAIAIVKFSMSAPLRVGLRNLRRPRSHATMLIATIATGTMMMVGTLTSGAIIMRAADAKLPYDLSSSVLIVGFRDSHRAQVRSFAESLPGVEKVEMRTETKLRVTSVDGIPVSPMGLWFVAECSAQGLAIDRDVQRRLGVKLGSRFDFAVGNQDISTTVASIGEQKFSNPLKIDCAGIDAANLSQQAVVHALPRNLQTVDEAIRAHFPGLAVIAAPEISQVIVEMSRDLQLLAQIVAWYSVAAGLCILVTLVAASRGQRLREAGILSALGATPGALAKIYTIEFMSIGAIAGMIGSGAACGFSSMLLGLVFHRWEITFGWQIPATAVLCSTLLTAAAGWMPTYSSLRRKPMDVLRGI